MCGIFCCIYKKGRTCLCENNKFDQIVALLKNRGPDVYSEIKSNFGDQWETVFTASTLWTQGVTPTKQPITHENGSIFMWNGDAYEGLDIEDKITSERNDSDNILSSFMSNGVECFKNVNGPFAFIFFNPQEQELWFGRDVFGRHSLLWSVTEDSLILSSVGESLSDEHKFTEVPSYGLFNVQFSSNKINLILYPWSHIPCKEVVIGIPLVIKNIFEHCVLGESCNYPWLDSEPKEDELGCFDNVSETPESYFLKITSNSIFSNTVRNLKELLHKSVQIRVQTKPDYCKDCIICKDTSCKHSKLGILFSGGLDSALLALLSDNFVLEDEPIDLYNVSFERESNHSYEDVPDRKNGRNTLEELRVLCPKRTWNFVEINVTRKELDYERQNHIRSLISPLYSVLDDSLGCALWFAARGKGILNGNLYTSPARIALLGMGADEMFGGYSKQRRIFSKEGWPGLGQELYRSLRQIGERNLGRDNRIVADHGRQPRLPYLDEKLVAFVDSLPPWQRCCLTPKMPIGIGDKLILRLLAWHLGLRGAAVLPKKALQFGSHIANPREKGHLISGRLQC